MNERETSDKSCAVLSGEDLAAAVCEDLDKAVKGLMIGFEIPKS